MDLDMLMSENCLVGVWITNKSAVRDLVLGAQGLFAAWGVSLVEEWIWVKTTINGEPVTPVNGVWRKPYEVLLLGRFRRGTQSPTNADSYEYVQTRVIASVPDLHSRKPCLEELIEPLMPDPTSYRALEVFARHLVAGWWSWGNECAKFNHEHCWAAIPSNDDATEYAPNVVA
jgi:N6-adenosine-specific RNA methylase IME4